MALALARACGGLRRTPVHYVTKHLQQGVESDHSRVKRPMPRIGCFQAFHTAQRTIQGFEAMLWLCKGFGFVSYPPRAQPQAWSARYDWTSWPVQAANQPLGAVSEMVTRAVPSPNPPQRAIYLENVGSVLSF